MAESAEYDGELNDSVLDGVAITAKRLVKTRRRSSMVGFIKGDIVIVPFLFSDLTKTKRRPALVIATLQGNDLILSQITSTAWRK
ncbi:hypothetical protein [Nostoc sp.]|uniref:hypothetical protein n=1 Tax=Nostoc sp. TaxID=1180 RepID=UPI002FF91535